MPNTLKLQATIERIRKLLRESFSEEHYWDLPLLTPKSISDAEVAGYAFILGIPESPQQRNYLCSFFYSVQPDDIGYLIPVILENLMECYLSGVLDDQYTIDFLFLLTVLDITGLSDEYFDLVSETHGIEEAKKGREKEKMLSEKKELQFQTLNVKQSESIYEWLLLVRTWSDLLVSPIFCHHLANAINYWSKRALKNV